MTEGVPPEELYKHVKPGDIMLTRGSSVYSYTIQCMQCNVYNHAAMIYSVDPATKQVMVSESNASGVMVVPFEAFIAMQFCSDIIILHATKPISPARIVREHKVLDGRPYERHPAECFRAVIDCNGACCHSACTNKRNLDSVFCSEYVAEMLFLIEYIPRDKPSNEYVPGDFMRMPDYFNNEEITRVALPKLPWYMSIYNFFRCV